MPAALYSGNRYGADIHGGQGHLPRAAMSLQPYKPPMVCCRFTPVD